MCPLKLLEGDVLSIIPSHRNDRTKLNTIFEVTSAFDVMSESNTLSLYLKLVKKVPFTRWAVIFCPGIASSLAPRVSCDLHINHGVAVNISIVN